MISEQLELDVFAPIGYRTEETPIDNHQLTPDLAADDISLPNEEKLLQDEVRVFRDRASYKKTM